MAKLSKAAVKKKIRSIISGTFGLFKDKLAHPDSNVPMSISKLTELHNTFTRVFKKL
tara:strand:- start:212 stop:382 length:171 start_codon:yes stop_codon:yes gene_type:complete